MAVRHHQILYKLILDTKAKLVVELGTGGGESTKAIVKALEVTDGILYSVDIDANEFFAEVLEPLRKSLAGNKRVVFVKDDAGYARKWLRYIRKPIDILFHDASHEYEDVYVDLLLWMKAHPKIILVHDVRNFNLPPPEPRWGGPAHALKKIHALFKRIYSFCYHDNLILRFCLEDVGLGLLTGIKTYNSSEILKKYFKAELK